MAANPLPAEILLGVALISGWAVLQCLKTLSGHLRREIARHDLLVETQRIRLEHAQAVAALRDSYLKSGRKRRRNRPAAPVALPAVPEESDPPPER